MIKKLAQYHPAAAAKSLQSCLTLYDPIDSSPPGSPIPGILQARTLEWVAIAFPISSSREIQSNASSSIPSLRTPDFTALIKLTHWKKSLRRGREEIHILLLGKRQDGTASLKKNACCLIFSCLQWFLPLPGEFCLEVGNS